MHWRDLGKLAGFGITGGIKENCIKCNAVSIKSNAASIKFNAVSFKSKYERIYIKRIYEINNF